MSRVFDALQQSELERTGQVVPKTEAAVPSVMLQRVESSFGLSQTTVIQPNITSESRLVAVTDDGSLSAEKYRVLATRLNHLQQQRPIKKLVITSASSQEGKSVTSCNLALTFAKRMNKRVLLIEGDLRQPAVANLLGVIPQKGISEWFSKGHPVSECLFHVADLPLWILPAGDPPEHPLDILQSDRVPEMLNQFMAWFDWILIDSPPILPMADLALWSRQSDGLIMVVRQDHTPKKFIAKAMDAIEKSKLLGVVFNEGTESHHRVYLNYYNNILKKKQQQRESESKG